MKKINIIVLFLFLMLIMPISVLAKDGFSVSENNITMYVGESKTIAVTATNSAGKIDISSFNTKVAVVSPAAIFVDNSSESITIEAKEVGNTFISVKASEEYATYEEVNLAGTTQMITVNVIKKEEPAQQTTPNPTPTTPKPTQTQTQTQTSTPAVQQEVKSTNNKVKELTVEGCQVEKLDDNNYNVNVLNGVNNITITVVPEDSKSTVSGDGTKELQDGENTFSVVVTSESGDQNTINVKVTRKNGYTLDDLDQALNQDNVIDISIARDAVISSDNLSKIKESGKVVYLNYYDDNNKLIYSIIIDGSTIEDLSELNTNILDASEEINTDKEDAMRLNIKSNFPAGTKIKLYVGDKYNNGKRFDVYYYDSENQKLELHEGNVKGAKDYITFTLGGYKDYFVTMLANSSTPEEKETGKTLPLRTILIIVLVIGLIIILTILFLQKKKEKQNANVANNQDYNQNMNYGMTPDNNQYNQNMDNSYNMNGNIDLNNNMNVGYVPDNSNNYNNMNTGYVPNNSNNYNNMNAGYVPDNSNNYNNMNDNSNYNNTVDMNNGDNNIISMDNGMNNTNIDTNQNSLNVLDSSSLANSITPNSNIVNIDSSSNTIPNQEPVVENNNEVINKIEINSENKEVSFNDFV